MDAALEDLDHPGIQAESSRSPNEREHGKGFADSGVGFLVAVVVCCCLTALEHILHILPTVVC